MTDLWLPLAGSHHMVGLSRSQPPEGGSLAGEAATAKVSAVLLWPVLVKVVVKIHPHPYQNLLHLHLH